MVKPLLANITSSFRLYDCTMQLLIVTFECYFYYGCEAIYSIGVGVCGSDEY